MAADGPVAGGNVLFLDIGVESVKENADIRMADFLREPAASEAVFRK